MIDLKSGYSVAEVRSLASVKFRDRESVLFFNAVSGPNTPMSCKSQSSILGADVDPDSCDRFSVERAPSSTVPTPPVESQVRAILTGTSKGSSEDWEDETALYAFAEGRIVRGLHSDSTAEGGSSLIGVATDESAPDAAGCKPGGEGAVREYAIGRSSPTRGVEDDGFADDLYDMPMAERPVADLESVAGRWFFGCNLEAIAVVDSGEVATPVGDCRGDVFNLQTRPGNARHSGARELLPGIMGQTVSRGDGWELDAGSSTVNRLVWVKAGQDPVFWHRADQTGLNDKDAPKTFSKRKEGKLEDWGGSDGPRGAAPAGGWLGLACCSTLRGRQFFDSEFLSPRLSPRLSADARR